MFTWKKLGHIFDPTKIEGESWMHEYAQAPSVIIFDKFVRVFFSSRPPSDGNGQFVSRMGYIDLNRENLFEILNICKFPILPLGGFGTFDEFGTYPISVIKNDNELRAYYAGWTRCESVPFTAVIGLAISKNNGESFERFGEGPILTYSPFEPFALGSPKIRKFNGVWYLWYTATKEWKYNNGSPQPVYKIRMATSIDGVNWEKDGKDLIPNIIEEDECQASADVFFYNNKYHMFFSYRYNLNFKETNRGYQMGYASSVDLKIWERDDKKAGISPSNDGWDSNSISYPFVFELDKEIYMLYQGDEMGRYGFGLAQLENYKA